MATKRSNRKHFTNKLGSPRVVVNENRKESTNSEDGLLNGSLNIAPLIWGVLDALRTCFPATFCAYLMFYQQISASGLGFGLGFGRSHLGLSNLRDDDQNQQHSLDGFESDPHAKIYSSFLDDRRAIIDLNDIDKIKDRGYQKYRFVSTAFLKRNALLPAASATSARDSRRSSRSGRKTSPGGDATKGKERRR